MILAATDFSTRSHRALRRAGLLARDRSAELAVLHVVDDDRPQDLVDIDKREAERILTEQISAVEELQGVRSRAVVAAGDPFDGILRTADALAADLIVMGPHRKQLLRDIFVGTTIERVVRTGPCPVLMVNTEPALPYGPVLAAVDCSDPSANAIRAAQSAGFIGDEVDTTILHAFSALGQGKLRASGVNPSAVGEYVAGERRRAAEELVSFLAASGLGGKQWSMRVEEGGAFKVIARVAAGTVPDLIVMGTHGRSGLAKVLLGSVTEQALRSLEVDIFAVPPVRARAGVPSIPS